MKKLIIGKLSLVAAFLLLIGFTACNNLGPTNNELALEPTNDEVVVEPTIEGHNKAIHDHVNAQPVYTETVEEVTRVRPDGTVEELLLVDGCIEMTREQYDRIVSENEDPIKQYRTTNLVSSPRTISVIGYTIPREATSSPVKCRLPSPMQLRITTP